MWPPWPEKWENELSSKKKRDASEDPVAKLWKLTNVVTFFRPPNNPQFSIIPKAIFSIELYTLLHEVMRKKLIFRINFMRRPL